MRKNLKVWTINHNLKLQSISKREWIMRWRDETTTPKGIGPRHDRDGKRLFCWMPNGERCFFRDCLTVREAQKRLWEIWEIEAHENHNALLVFSTAVEARQALNDL